MPSDAWPNPTDRGMSAPCPGGTFGWRRWLASGLVACACSGVARADLKSIFVDPEDGKLDASRWLLEKKGFLPIPILITEPAVGYGGGVGLTFFRQSIGEAAQRAKETGHVTPPDVFGIAAFGTENGSKGAGAGGMFSFKDDTWRYRGGVAKIDMNLDFYGTAGGLGSGERSVAYSLDGWIASNQVLRRIGSGASNDWVAARWVYLDFDSTFNLGSNRNVLPNFNLQSRSSGLGLSLEHDSRDNIFTASRGWTGAIDTLFYDPDWGSSTRFQSYRAHAFAYYPLSSTWVLGGRIDGRTANGNVPFYQLPYLDLRGVPAARYQDDHTALVEAELRWNMTPRWAVLGFAGAGRAWGQQQAFSASPTIVNKGFGFRYLAARALGLYTGLDFAWGPEDFAFYIQVGSAWR